MHNKLVNGIENLVYGSSNLHELLSEEKIGINGKNLTILILSYNRAESTIRLLNSIEKEISGYEGKVLILDNNSDTSELKKISEKISKYPFETKIVKEKENYGVAGGRNIGVDYVETEWIMSLDNDIYFIDNPLNSIEKALKKLGCKFLNIPLLDQSGTQYFLNGGHIYIDTLEDKIAIGGGSMFQQAKIEEFKDSTESLSTFLAGGACVYNKKTFIELGKYDSNYFIGLEDIDFSITIFRKGYKIGNCVGNFIVHNHAIAKTEEDYKYERTRFKKSVIKDSALYFEKKWGFNVWNKNLEMWLDQRQKDLNIKDEEKITMKKNIALVSDVHDWCFDHISKQIKKYLGQTYNIDIIYMEDFEPIYNLFYYVKKYDLVHYFWRGHISWLRNFNNEVFMNTYGISYDHFLENVVKKPIITTSVYDHLFIDKDYDLTKYVLNFVNSYTVSSNILLKIYNELNDIPKPYGEVSDGIDLEVFKMNDIHKYDNIDSRNIVIGWVGNSFWNKEDDEDFKGFNTIIKPVLDKLIKNGYPITTYYADKQTNQISYEKMPDYYNKIDILLCASKAEGTPNPILEAMASGNMVITTNVGLVPELFGKKQKEYILKNRSQDELETKILQVIKNRKIIKQISEENVEKIKKWTWKSKAKEFQEFFEYNLRSNKNENNEK